MKKKFFYSVMLCKDEIIQKNKLFIFLNSLYKTKDIKLFFVIIPSGGLKFLKKNKKFQKERGLKFGEQPVVSYKEEGVFTEINNSSSLAICLVAESVSGDYSELSNRIVAKNSFFKSISSNLSNFSQIDLITPLNMSFGVRSCILNLILI